MPPPIPVFLAPADPAWPRTAADLTARLQTFGAPLVGVHHIGSTSVPGLAAKPIIDLMAVVTTLDDLDPRRSLVEDLGWIWHGEFGIPGRRYCTLSDAGGGRIAQLHIFAAGSPHVERHLAFRDYLRAHREVAAAYEVEKRRAWALHPGDSHVYTDEKNAWIRRIEIDALAWFARQRPKLQKS